MDAFNTPNLRSLLEQQIGPCVSVYLETHPTGEQGQQDRIRLRNLLQYSQKELTAAGLRSTDARELLNKADALPNDPVFWRARSQGLAIFLAPARFETYRLPLKFEESASVGDRFRVRPLLPLLTDANQYYVLTLSQNNVRLFSGSRHALKVVDVPGLPSNMEQALNYAGADRGAQVHTAMHGSYGKQAAVFHGQGGEPDTHKENLTQFFRVVDAALAPVLHEKDRPLLLAGVEYLLPIYRAVASYSNIADEELTGNCDRLSHHQLHEQAAATIEPALEQARRVAAAKYDQVAGTERASNELQRILPAAFAGQIDTLFVDPRSTQWGSFDSQTLEVRLHERQQPGDDDLLELATVQTLVHGGTVYTTEDETSPTKAVAFALFRY